MSKNRTIRAAAKAGALGLAMAAVGASALAQQTTAPAAPVPPKGKVLFEGHQPTVSPDETPADTPAPVATPPTTQPTGKPGAVSSSNRHARTLRRRTDADPAVAKPEAPVMETAPDTATPPDGAPSSSSDVEQDEAIIVTASDLAASGHITAAERAAMQITATDLDLHLDTHTGLTEARAQITVRNTGSAPLKHLPLRISGTLKFESARLTAMEGTRPAAASTSPLEQHRIADDLDHTGVSTELAVALPQPLAPGATISLDLYYGGTLSATAARLLALGAPAERALRTDWDTVTDTFTGLRGLGNVLWYPVATPPALLRDGAAVPQAVESSRAAGAASSFRLQLTLEYTGARPDAAFFCGERQPLLPLGTGGSGNPSSSSQPEGTAQAEGGVVTASWTRTALGPHTPSLFVASAAPHTVSGSQLRVVTDRADTAAALGEAAARVRPMLAEWLGASPSRSLDVLDLPIPEAAGFSDGSLIVAPLSAGPANTLAPSLVQPLASTWLPANITAAWLREGIPAFLQAVWAERTSGRTAALNGLAANAAALATIAQPAVSSKAGAGVSSSNDTAEDAARPQGSLATCADAACARGRAAYVFEMLRSMLGDTELQGAIAGWRVTMEQPAGVNLTAAEETAAMERLLQQVAGTHKLDWFFASWIEAGRGLPELSIVTIAPRRVERNTHVNYLPQQRKPVAGPIGAEPVPQPGDPTYEAEHATITPGDRIAPAVGSWLVAVEVKNAGDTDAEVPITVRAGNLTNSMPLRVPAHGRATLRVPFEADPQEVLVNDGSVPETHTTVHRRIIASLPPAGN